MHRMPDRFYSANMVMLLWGVVGAVLAASIIYLTPLKWLTVVEPSINDMDPTAFQKAFEANPEGYIFIDVRPESVYTNFHAKGSVSMPLHTLFDTRHTLPKTGKEIVLICSGGRASGVGYHYLEHFGFFNVTRIAGGIENWALQGLPVEGTQAQEVRQ